MVDVIAVKSFIVTGSHGKFMINKFEHGKVISGFGFLKLKFNKSGDQIFHAEERVLGDELLSHAQYHTTYKNDPMMMEKLDNPEYRKDFLLKEEMQL